MIVEVRTYHLKPGTRARFLEIFRSRSMPLHAEIGMPIVGPFVDLESSDRFVFLRLFQSLEEREPRKSAFYEGRAWKTELEQVLMPMIERYDVMLTTFDSPRLAAGF
jgi:NIPSNAP